MEENIFTKIQELDYNDKFLEESSILVAEDNLINQILLRKFLKLWHVANLVIASDGQEAVDEFEQGVFDIVLLDIQMPVLDGFAVVKSIRENKDVKKSSVPILVFTASSYREIKDEMNPLKVDGFIEKPFTPESLYRKLTEHLASKKLS